jgi:hypothetical protein
MDELSRVNNDMKNLLNCTEIVTVFLDKKLLVRRFTSGADKLFKLSPAMWGDRSPTSSATCAIPTWPKTPGMCCGR